MGVSVSFNGRGGKRSFNLTGVPVGDAANILGDHKKKAIIPDNIRRAMHPQPLDPTASEKEGKVKLNAFDARPDTLDKKTMPGSAVTTSPSGLCLQGEETNPVVEGTKFYGSHNGKKGYYALSEVDRGDSQKRIGPFGAGGEGADNEESSEGQALVAQVASRVVMEVDSLGRQVLVEYDKDVATTPLGRVQKITSERRRVIGVITPSKDGEDGALHPFKLRYKEGWQIWLPSDGLLNYDNKPVDIKNSLSQVGDAKEPWWYDLGGVLSDGGGELYLNIDTGEEDNSSSDDGGVSPDDDIEDEEEVEVTASFGNSPSGDISIAIATATNVNDNPIAYSIVNSPIYLEGKDKDEDKKCVESLNELIGAIEIVGGDKIEVSVEDKKIKISYNEDKEDEEGDGEGEEEDDCKHDETGDMGGVSPDEESHGSGNAGQDVGGVPAEGESHEGDEDCCNHSDTKGESNNKK